MIITKIYSIIKRTILIPIYRYTFYFVTTLLELTKYLWFTIPSIYFPCICKRYLLDWKVSNIFPVINNLYIKNNILCRGYNNIVEVENIEIMSVLEVLHGFALFLITLAHVIHYTNLFYGRMQ